MAGPLTRTSSEDHSGSNHWLPNSVHKMICSEPGAGNFHSKPAGTVPLALDGAPDRQPTGCCLHLSISLNTFLRPPFGSSMQA
ncbi:hypothetical protein EVAR_63052_1 [Eumeta japonica]|uniref:Uncharacterized protein n=1 Tax=Eumeta variegata TaxID=151549 RepID=A0A4C1Z9Q8_EUMVA|nr:hypothetical protein EVAR_63052_1 [Eumeta japonica]